MAANKVTAVRLGWGGNRRSGTIEPHSSAGGFFRSTSPQEAFDLALSRASRRPSRRSRRRFARPAGCRSVEMGDLDAAMESSTAGTWPASDAAGRASIRSSTARPLAVIFHPPLRRSTSPCDQMSRSGALAASRLVRSAQSRPLVARIAMSRLRSYITANPSGYAARIFKTVTWKFTSAPRLSVSATWWARAKAPCSRFV